MPILLWFLRLLGLTQLAAAVEAYRAQGQVDANTHAQEVNDAVQQEKDDVAAMPDDALDDVIDELRTDAISRNGSGQ